MCVYTHIYYIVTTIIAVDESFENCIWLQLGANLTSVNLHFISSSSSTLILMGCFELLAYCRFNALLCDTVECKKTSVFILFPGRTGCIVRSWTLGKANWSSLPREWQSFQGSCQEPMAGIQGWKGRGTDTPGEYYGIFNCIKYSYLP